MLAGLVPEVVVVRESDDPASWSPSDWPEEAALVARATPRRRLEHGAVRNLARQALADLDVTPAPILPGRGRQPGWPSGVVGSLTHTRGYGAAAVARTSEVVALGIDAEADTPLRPGLVRRLCAPAELDRLRWFDPDPDAAGKALFSIKEAIYKAWFPIAGRWLGFLDVDVHAEPDGTFEVVVLVDAPAELTRLSGRFERAEGYVRAAVTVLV